MKILVTGAAGFIGMHTCRRLLARGDEVWGIDNLNDYYDVSLKAARLATLESVPRFKFTKLDITDTASLNELFRTVKFERVVHLAAQAGVRYSIENPRAYVDSNLVGFLNILEACRHNQIAHLVYASSSSVYGGNAKVPFSEQDPVDHPVSLYAATKKANELMAHTYSHLYRLPATGLRFFTVYGPWGRPDMSPSLFARAIFEGRPIQVFNHGQMSRDFTYIDDIVEGVIRTLDKPATADSQFDRAAPNPGTSDAPWRVFNIGNQQPTALLDYIRIIETAVGKPAILDFKPMQDGDVLATHADTTALDDWVGFAPATSLEVGMARYIEWVRGYYGYR